MLIVWGDLNLTLFAYKVWGVTTRLDSLAQFFGHFFESSKLLDADSVPLALTWRNGNLSNDRVSKRLDSYMLEGCEKYRIWIREGGISDHFPMLLQMERGDSKPPGPFMFNHC